MFRDFNNVEHCEKFFNDSHSMIPIDQYDAQDFNLNDAGWVRNDISQLARAQSKAEFDMIMARLQVLKESKSIPDDISIDEAIASIRPRWCQSPNELEVWAEMTNGEVMSKLDDAYIKSVKVPDSVSDGTTASSSESAD